MRAKRLGRGLGSLLNKTEVPAVVERAQATPPETKKPNGRGTKGRRTAPPVEEAAPKNGAVHEVPIEAIRPNPFQPRRQFREEGLEELQASIDEHGVLQPIVLRRTGDGTYEVVAGERRLRASRNLGLDRIPSIVRAATDEDMQTLALVENLQREDLNAMEKSRALRAMMRNFTFTQEDVATRVGKARATIANLLRLLDLPEEIQGFVEAGKLSGAHARAILQAEGAKRRLDLARRAIERGWSVREVERRARLGPTVGKRRTRPEDPYVKDLENRLRQALSTDVRLKARGKGGRIEIPYQDADDLDRLLELFKA